MRYSLLFDIQENLNSPAARVNHVTHHCTMHLPFDQVDSSLFHSVIHSSDEKNVGPSSPGRLEHKHFKEVRVPEKYPDIFGSDDEVHYIEDESQGAQ